MDIYQDIFELIDTRSFTSMWFWIVLAVFWSMLSHFIMGVPFDLLQRAQRHGGQAMADLEALARINANRLLQIGGAAGLVLTAIATCMLSALFLLGFIYGAEVCQALFFLALPFTIVGLLSQRTARLVIERDGQEMALIRRLKRHRIATQAIGVVSIFVTAFWGIFKAMSTSVLGG